MAKETIGSANNWNTKTQSMLRPAYCFPISGHHHRRQHAGQKYESILLGFYVIGPHGEYTLAFHSSTITGLRCTHLLTEFVKPGVLVLNCLCLLFGIK